MKIYTCEKCNKNFKQKVHYNKHIFEKKIPCINLYENSSDEDKKNQNNNIIDCENLKNDYSEIDNILNINYENNNKNKCLYCETVFTRNTNLQRHLKSRCKSKIYYGELEKLKEKLDLIAKEKDLIAKENEILKKIKNNTKITNNKINNGTINNNSNNVNIVQLVQFGNENIDNIDIKEAFNTYINSTGGNIASNILKLTNFNKKYPENHNIYITDLSREYVKIYNGTKFITKKFKIVKGDILNKVINNSYKIVDKLQNDKSIKKNKDIQSKLKINNVSLKLIDGQSPEDIVRDEIINKNIFLTNKNNIDSCSENELNENREFNFEERLRIKFLEDKQSGLINFVHEKIKDELYNNKSIIINDK